MGSSVIECPSCNTKFAVNLHLDPALEPLFHCSRCGHYFKEVTMAKQLDLIDAHSNPMANTIYDSVSSNAIPSYSTNKAIDNTLNKYKFENEKAESKTISEQKIDWPKPLNVKPNEALATASNTNYSTPAKPTYYFGDGQFDEDELDEIEDDSLYENDKPRLSFLNAIGLNKTGIKSSNEFYKQFALFCLIPLFVTLGLCAWAYNFDETPQFVNELFNLESKSLATVAPAGLELSSLKPEILTLDSGKKAFLIKGEVINSTTNSYNNLMIEAKLFTKDNTELVRLIAPLDSKLRDAKNINSIRANNLIKLQSDLSNDRTTITPSLRIPFSVVIPEIKGNETWYSARVYSVNAA